MIKKFGIVTKTKGTLGAVTVEGLPSKIFSLPPGLEIEAGFNEKFTENLTVNRWKKAAANKAVIFFDEIRSQEDAGRLVEKGLYYDEEMACRFAELLPGEEKCSGFLVKTSDGKHIGKIVGTLSTPAHDIFVVKGKESEIMIPDADEFIKTINEKEMLIEVELIDGLLELNKKTGAGDED